MYIHFYWPYHHNLSQFQLPSVLKFEYSKHPSRRLCYGSTSHLSECRENAELNFIHFTTSTPTYRAENFPPHYPSCWIPKTQRHTGMYVSILTEPWRYCGVTFIFFNFKMAGLKKLRSHKEVAVFQNLYFIFFASAVKLEIGFKFIIVFNLNLIVVFLYFTIVHLFFSLKF